VRAFPNIQDEQRRLFAAMLTSLDRAVGTVLTKLREKGVEDDTLIVFVSDNGGPTAELTSSNAPFRGGKGQLFEGGIRVPFCLQWKGHIQPQTFEHPVITLDILPTALAAAGAAAPSGLDGRNLLPHLTGRNNAPPHEALFWRYGRNIALRRGRYKLVRQGPPEDVFALFDLASDPGETRDLSASEPGRAAELRRELARMDAGMKPPLW
jgi:arylsulfatase B